MTSLFFALAFVTAGPELQLSCDEAQGLLRWQLGSVAMTIDDGGFRLSDGPLFVEAPPPKIVTRSFVLETGEPRLVAEGATLKRCQSNGRCTGVAALPASVTAALRSDDGYLLGGGKPVPGLYRATRTSPELMSLLVPGDVLALCPSRDGAWVVMRDASGFGLVSASAATPAVRLWSRGEMVMRAISDASLDAARAALQWVFAESLPERRNIVTLVAQSSRAELRALAPSYLLALGLSLELGSGASVFWLLAHDRESSVRRAALAAVAANCAKGTKLDCPGLFGMFVDDADPEVSLQARDRLLELAPEIALFQASSAYKLDAVAVLAARMQRLGAEAVLPALQILIRDEDAQVRGAAKALLGQFEQ